MPGMGGSGETGNFSNGCAHLCETKSGNCQHRRLLLLSLLGARWLLALLCRLEPEHLVDNTVRLRSAIGYVTPLDRLQNCHTAIFAARDPKLETAR